MIVKKKEKIFFARAPWPKTDLGQRRALARVGHGRKKAAIKSGLSDNVGSILP
jgi:hypothetical protein